MSEAKILRIGSVKNVAQFAEHLHALQLRIPCDSGILLGAESPLFSMVSRGSIKIGNRFAINPMEGWDGTADGAPTENTLRRWRRFGASGAKLIWGGEAVAVSHSGRANPNQLVIAERTRAGLAAAAANGRKGGRLRKVDDADAAKARSLRDKGITATDIAKMLGVSRATVYRYLSEASSVVA